jgi:hypothetical protein
MRDYKSIDEIIAEIRGSGPDHIERDLDAFFQQLLFFRRFQLDTSNTAPAFMAIASLATILWGENADDDHEPEAFGGVDPERMISVPFWSLHAIAVGWFMYLDTRHYQSMEQAFGIRVSQPGTRSRLDTEETKVRDKAIAVEVAQCLGPDQKRGDVQEAILRVASLTMSQAVEKCHFL